MPKKKSAVGSSVVDKDWEAGLTRTPFEEESWQACVSFVVGSNPEDEELVRILASQPSLRRLFSLLTWDSTLAKICELGNSKSKRSDDAPLFYEVTEPAKVLLDASEEIPTDLMAKIVKFQLLDIKAQDQQRREDEKAEEEPEKAPPPSSKKDKGQSKASAKKEKKEITSTAEISKEKTKLKRRDDVEPPTFIDDEPDYGPEHYILVMGFYEPDLIGTLDAIGVHVANVIKLSSQHTRTSESGDQKDSPVLDAEAGNRRRVQARKLDQFWSGLKLVLDSGPMESKLNDVVQLSYTVPTLSPLQTPKHEAEMAVRVFQDLASLIYDCLDWRMQHQHYLNNLKLTSLPTGVGLNPQETELPSPQSPTNKSELEESQPDQETTQPPLPADTDTRYYRKLLDMVPPEACTVPLILHSMLEQVVISTEQASSSLPHVTEEHKPGPGLDHQLVSFMLQSFLPLAHTKEERSHMLSCLLTTVHEEDKKKLTEMFGAAETQKSEQPLVIRHHNERSMRLRNINEKQSFDPAEVESSMMKLSAVWRLIHSGDQRSRSNSCWMAIKQQLKHHCADDDASWPEVERLFHQSVFESMPLAGPDQKGVLNAPGSLGTLEPAHQHTPTIIPWDNPLSYAKQQLNKHLSKATGPSFLTEDLGHTKQVQGEVCSQLDVSDIQSCRRRSLSDWHYAERHDASVFPQVLQSASEEYRCLDTFRGSHNNILYIFCHNPMSPDRQCRELWEVTLHTLVKFRKYLEHVAGTISDWTEEEERKMEAAQLRNISASECQKEEEEKAPDSAGKDFNPEPVIKNDSLKAWMLEQEQLKEQEMIKKSKKESAAKSKQQKVETGPTDLKKDRAKSSGARSRAEAASKNPKESATATVPPVVESVELQPTEEPFNGFTGYSMDGKLIHISGRLQYLFPTEGGQITVEKISYVEGSDLMKVAVRKDGHHFYTHINQVNVTPPPPRPQPEDAGSNGNKEGFKVSEPALRVKQGSLTAVLDSGIHLSYSFYGPTAQYKVSPQEAQRGVPETSAPSSTHHSEGTDLDSRPCEANGHASPPESQVCEGQPAMPSNPFNSLNLSVPNGLLLQFLREDAQGVSSEEQGVLVRQCFPLHGGGVVGQLRDPSLSRERSRIVTSQGAVIRSMRDGSTEILFADGSVSFSQDSGPVWVPDSEIEVENTSREATDNEKEPSSQKEADAQSGCWLTTTPCGTRIRTVCSTHEHTPATPLLIYKTTDPITHEVMLSREDLVVSVQDPDGSLCVDHADGTRITTLYQDRPNTPPQHTGEPPECVTPKSTCECACSCAECERCTDSMNEDFCSDGEGKACDKEVAGHTCGESRDSEGESSVSPTGEESVIGEESCQRSASESEKGSASMKERVVVVEKEGCATVVMYPERHTAHVFLGDGTVVTGNNRGAYEVFPSSTGLLQIQSDGQCVYSSDPLVTPSLEGGVPEKQVGSYTMSHADKVACDMTDPDGNHFQVMEDGQLSVLSFSPAPSTLKQDEEEPEEADGELAGINGKHQEPCPRLFLVHEDGSGTELLSSQTVEELLYQAYSDPTIALLKEPLPDSQDEFGITILKPGHQGVWSQWLLGKQNPNITPPNLRNRSWHDFPPTEKKSPGPPLGVNMGKGLTLTEKSGGSPAQHQPIRSCPKVLEMRELYQHRRVTTRFEDTVDTRLKMYIESLVEREQRLEQMEVKDPRTEEESGHASDLLNLVLSFAEEEDAGQSFDRRTSVDIVNLYNRQVGVPVEQSDTPTLTSDSFTSGKESKWTERHARHRQEMSEEQAYREALRKKKIVPFFHPEHVPLYQDQIPEMRSLATRRPLVHKSGGAEAFRKDVPPVSAAVEMHQTPRPLNPTPTKSASHATESDRKDGQRPTNPTPQTAGESNLGGSSEQCKPVDVTGKPRRTKVRVPASVLTSKPCSTPNQQSLSAVESVGRKCRTVSQPDHHVIARGFQLLPSSVDLGTVREGTSSRITVRMKNVGVDVCRFHVKQPPPASGLRVIYTPGPVAAGLHAELQVCLFALSTVQAGEVEPKRNISQDIIINTETDILHLHVTATILPQRLYDIWLKERPKKSSRVCQMISSLPSI